MKIILITTIFSGLCGTAIAQPTTNPYDSYTPGSYNYSVRKKQEEARDAERVKSYPNTPGRNGVNINSKEYQDAKQQTDNSERKYKEKEERRKANEQDISHWQAEQRVKEERKVKAAGASTKSQLDAAGFMIHSNENNELFKKISKSSNEEGIGINRAIEKAIGAKNEFNKNKTTASLPDLLSYVSGYLPFYFTAMSDLDTIAIKFGNEHANLDSMKIMAICYYCYLNTNSALPPTWGSEYQNWDQQKIMDQELVNIILRNPDMVFQIFSKMQKQYLFRPHSAVEIAIKVYQQFGYSKKGLSELNQEKQSIVKELHAFDRRF